MKILYDLELSELEDLIQSWGEPAYRAQQIWQGLYQNSWISPNNFTNLPSILRDRLADNFQFPVLAPVTTLYSSDGQTEKTLFRLHDGQAIETVIMRYEKRNTLCISTQVGCAMGCVFCATGQMGFRRNLSSGEIVAQVMQYAHLLRELGKRITNVVLMGMGEPFHNYKNVMAAIDRLNDIEGFAFGARHFTVSTVGLIPAIRRFTAEKRQVNLAISLHAAKNELRNSMLPINRRYPLEDLLKACQEYVAYTRRRITFEWALINGVNDTPQQAYLLASKLKGMLCHVNAIPLNPTSGYPSEATDRIGAANFQKILVGFGIPCTVRLRRGMDIRAGCGQLAVWS